VPFDQFQAQLRHRYGQEDKPAAFERPRRETGDEGAGLLLGIGRIACRRHDANWELRIKQNLRGDPRLCPFLKWRLAIRLPLPR
jgi:hypothetical protein